MEIKRRSKNTFCMEAQLVYMIGLFLVMLVIRFVIDPKTIEVDPEPGKRKEGTMQNL